MKIVELNEYELKNTNGGSEASDGLCYLLGVGAHYLCKGLLMLAEGASAIHG